MQAVTLNKFGVDDAARRFQFFTLRGKLWVNTMQAFQQRVVEEKLALEDKVVRLGVFLNSATFKGLPEDERDRMTRQYRVMVDYRGILQERIDAMDLGEAEAIGDADPAS